MFVKAFYEPLIHTPTSSFTLTCLRLKTRPDSPDRPTDAPTEGDGLSPHLYRGLLPRNRSAGILIPAFLPGVPITFTQSWGRRKVWLAGRPYCQGPSLLEASLRTQPAGTAEHCLQPSLQASRATAGLGRVEQGTTNCFTAEQKSLSKCSLTNKLFLIHKINTHLVSVLVKRWDCLKNCLAYGSWSHTADISSAEGQSSGSNTCYHSRSFPRTPLTQGTASSFELSVSGTSGGNSSSTAPTCCRKSTRQVQN